MNPTSTSAGSGGNFYPSQSVLSAAGLSQFTQYAAQYPAQTMTMLQSITTNLTPDSIGTCYNYPGNSTYDPSLQQQQYSYLEFCHQHQLLRKKNSLAMRSKVPYPTIPPLSSASLQVAPLAQRRAYRGYPTDALLLTEAFTTNQCVKCNSYRYILNRPADSFEPDRPYWVCPACFEGKLGGYVHSDREWHAKYPQATSRDVWAEVAQPAASVPSVIPQSSLPIPPRQTAIQPSFTPSSLPPIKPPERSTAPIAQSTHKPLTVSSNGLNTSTSSKGAQIPSNGTATNRGGQDRNSKDKEQDKGQDKGQDKARGRDQDTDRDRDRERDRNRARDKVRERDRQYDSDRDRQRDKEREKDREWKRSRERSFSRDRDRDRDSDQARRPLKGSRSSSSSSSSTRSRDPSPVRGTGISPAPSPIPTPSSSRTPSPAQLPAPQRQPAVSPSSATLPPKGPAVQQSSTPPPSATSTSSITPPIPTPLSLKTPANVSTQTPAPAPTLTPIHPIPIVPPSAPGPVPTPTPTPAPAPAPALAPVLASIPPAEPIRLLPATRAPFKIFGQVVKMAPTASTTSPTPVAAPVSPIATPTPTSSSSSTTTTTTAQTFVPTPALSPPSDNPHPPPHASSATLIPPATVPASSGGIVSPGEPEPSVWFMDFCRRTVKAMRAPSHPAEVFLHSIAQRVRVSRSLPSPDLDKCGVVYALITPFDTQIYLGQTSRSVLDLGYEWYRRYVTSGSEPLPQVRGMWHHIAIVPLQGGTLDERKQALHTWEREINISPL